MLDMTKTALSLVLCLLMSILPPTTMADGNIDLEAPNIEFDQSDGIVMDSVINLTGTSNVPLTSIEISIWNISMPDQWSLVTSSPFLDIVVPYSDSESDKTIWSWSHDFQVGDLECTCYVEVSLMEQTDLISFGLVVYVGDSFHRPVLTPTDSLESMNIYSMEIFNTDVIALSYDVLLPLEEGFSSQSNTNIMPNMRICPAPNGICTEEYTALLVNSTFSEKLELSFNMDENSIYDGYYLLQVQVQDELLTLSNNFTQYVLFDKTQPSVQLSAVEQVNESESIVVDIDVDDGYTGSSYDITWSITEPDGLPRSVLSSEILVDNRLEFSPTKSGQYQVNALVRDTGGFLVAVNHNVNVTNIDPSASVRYDGFLIEDGTIVTVATFSNWLFSANSSTDSQNDVDGLEYFWYVDGKSLLSGQSYLSSSDVQSSSFKEIRVEVVDDDGSSSNLSFEVVQQASESEEPMGNAVLMSLLALFFILFVAMVLMLKQRGKSDVSSGFVKWTERSDDSKN